MSAAAVATACTTRSTPLTTTDHVFPRTRLTDTYSSGGKGWFGTVQAGCDYQFYTGSWAVVVGAFGDYDFADIKGRRADAVGVINSRHRGCRRRDADGLLVGRWPYRRAGHPSAADLLLGRLL